MARGRRRRVMASGPFDGLCPRCDLRINDYKDAVKRHGVWIHKGCAPGGDDE